jgi:ABC-type multidrug transport system ATPase subunit
MLMKISLTDAGKRFNRDWIFRHLHYEFESGQSYAIIGPNGSGKSTLLQVISGAMQVSEGLMQWEISNRQLVPPIGGSNKQLASEEVFQQISISAPYLELVEEMNLKEFLEFHKGFKSFLPGLTVAKIISIIGLEKSVHKQIRNYSSGMKQRVKLAQAIFSDTPVLLLDEPCTNLDLNGIELYNRCINDYCKNKLVIVSSNDEVEYRFCKKKLNISDYRMSKQ